MEDTCRQRLLMPYYSGDSATLLRLLRDGLRWLIARDGWPLRRGIDTRACLTAFATCITPATMPPLCATPQYRCYAATLLVGSSLLLRLLHYGLLPYMILRYVAIAGYSDITPYCIAALAMLALRLCTLAKTLLRDYAERRLAIVTPCYTLPLIRRYEMADGDTLRHTLLHTPATLTLRHYILSRKLYATYYTAAAPYYAGHLYVSSRHTIRATTIRITPGYYATSRLNTTSLRQGCLAAALHIRRHITLPSCRDTPCRDTLMSFSLAVDTHEYWYAV